MAEVGAKVNWSVEPEGQFHSRAIITFGSVTINRYMCYYYPCEPALKEHILEIQAEKTTWEAFDQRETLD
jgi:hypothetical protein